MREVSVATLKLGPGGDGFWALLLALLSGGAAALPVHASAVVVRLRRAPLPGSTSGGTAGTGSSSSTSGGAGAGSKRGSKGKLQGALLRVLQVSVDGLSVQDEVRGTFGDMM